MNMNPMRSWRRRTGRKAPVVIAALAVTALGAIGGAALPPETSGQAASAQAAADPSSCNIKGNVSTSGERIYHMPGQKYYARTAINPRHGERWFCSEAEARAAGWRRSKV